MASKNSCNLSMNLSCAQFNNNLIASADYESISQLNLPCYHSREELSLRIYDYSNVFVLPVICLFGIVTNSLNIFILLRTRIAENIHLYMLVGSVSDLLYLLTQVFIALFRCGAMCPYGYVYATKAYELYVYLYVGYVIITFSACVDISVSIDRIKLFSRGGTLLSRHIFALRCVILFIISAVLVMPDYALARGIVPKGVLVHTHGSGNDTYYTYEILYTKAMRKDWLLPALQVPLTVLTIIKGPALIGLVLLADIIVVVKFNNHLKNKRKMTFSAQTSKERKENREANRATYMIISMSLLYFAGNSLDSLDALIELFGVDLYDNMPMYVVMGNVFLFSSHGLYIFIFYNFDKEYNRLFQRLILRRKRLTRMSGAEITEGTNK